MRKLLLSLALVSTSAVAQHGADVLLQSTGTEVAPETAAQMPSVGQFKLSDAYLQTLFVEWKGMGQQSFEVNRWFTLMMTGKHAQAAHLWSSMQEHFPEALRPIAQESWVYLTWRMQLPQTFIEAYSTARMNPQAPERLRLALDQTISMEAGHAWVTKHKPLLSQTFKTHLLTLTQPAGMELELLAWAVRGNFEHSERVLNLLPMGHPLSLELAKTAVLNFARKGQVGDAGKLLKRRIEPELEKLKNPRELSRHYLTLGRLLYQAGALEASEAFYARIPRGVPEFVPARTERTWALLRLGRVGELRGELESLSHQVFSDRFLPEVALVRSISNLKLCRYQDVAQDFNAFISAHKVWSQKISSALENPETAKVDMSDDKIQALQAAISNLATEDKQLTKLAVQSVKAALPAVGEQAHWVNARAQVLASHNEIKRQVVQETQRFWKNREVVLKEAIRKMKFVRVEALAQVRMNTLAENSQDVTDTIKRVQAAPQKGAQTYPFEGVYWPDELFKLHAQAESRCGGKK